ncbi:MAG: glycosyltransferase family 4 protein, partial [Chloroflexi bacterium]|nr:glycosyltransferase family 4 protein [Chloroflexota bacterium]
IARSPYRERITFVNRYVHDAELDGYLRGADAVVLPYRRSSLSGPLHVAMGYGLPIVMTDTGGNGEAAEGYAGILLTPVGDIDALTQRLRELPALRGQVFEHPRSWSATADAYLGFIDGLDGLDGTDGAVSGRETVPAPPPSPPRSPLPPQPAGPPPALSPRGAWASCRAPRCWQPRGCSSWRPAIPCHASRWASRRSCGGWACCSSSCPSPSGSSDVRPTGASGWRW